MDNDYADLAINILPPQPDFSQMVRAAHDDHHKLEQRKSAIAGAFKDVVFVDSFAPDGAFRKTWIVFPGPQSLHDNGSKVLRNEAKGKLNLMEEYRLELNDGLGTGQEHLPVNFSRKFARCNFPMPEEKGRKRDIYCMTSNDKQSIEPLFHALETLGATPRRMVVREADIEKLHSPLFEYGIEKSAQRGAYFASKVLPLSFVRTDPADLPVFEPETNGHARVHVVRNKKKLAEALERSKPFTNGHATNGSSNGHSHVIKIRPSVDSTSYTIQLLKAGAFIAKIEGIHKTRPQLFLCVKKPMEMRLLHQVLQFDGGESDNDKEAQRLRPVRPKSVHSYDDYYFVPVSVHLAAAISQHYQVRILSEHNAMPMEECLSLMRIKYDHKGNGISK